MSERTRTNLFGLWMWMAGGALGAGLVTHGPIAVALCATSGVICLGARGWLDG